MDELQTALAEVLKTAPQRMVLSAPRPDGTLRRATAVPLAGGWQLETLTATQAFHRNLPQAELPAALEALLREQFFQLTATTGQQVHALRVTKKGRVLTSRYREKVAQKPASASGAAKAGPAGEVPAPGTAKAGPAGQAPASPSPRQSHDREKKRPLPEGEVIPALVEIGVLTAEGRPVAAMRDKWRQINRFVELVADVLPDALPGAGAAAGGPFKIVDFGCGKSYLSFVLYHYLTRVRGMDVEMTGLDLKADVIEKCNAAAQKYGYTGLLFEVGDIAGYQGAGADLVVTLHACDTATDLALAHAVAWGTRAILSVPCCQHELNAQMKSEVLALLTRYGLVKERSAALFTDAIRANLLAACGYKAQLVEFVDFEHTPKNIMIRAVKASLPTAHRKERLAEVERLCAAFSLDPALLRLLRVKNLLQIENK